METSRLPTQPAIAYIQSLATQLDELYQNTRFERRTLADWEEDLDFSILGILELFSGDIQGYIEQVAIGAESFNRSDALHHLRQLNALEIDYFANWYFTASSNYPEIKRYIEQLDHLRLLLVEQFTFDLPIAS
jgi:hypothetical protein